MTQIEGFYGNGSIFDNYESRLTDWNAGTRSQIAAALNHFGIQAGRFASTQSALQQIQNASQSATGRMQVLQAGNQIAGLMVNQIQDLHATVMAAEQARLNYVAAQNARDEQDRLRQQRWLGKAKGKY